MKILVIGAGVLGSLYAARLYEAGHAVTVLARGKRVEELREHGIVLENGATGEVSSAAVAVVDHLEAEDAYDLALVLVRKNQLAGAIDALRASERIGTALFMMNNAAGPRAMIEALGREKVLLGFPGAGGQRVGERVRYQVVGEAQPTTIGELDGGMSQRVLTVARILEEAGFAVEISRDMDAWLKTHVALVSPIANALYLAGGDNYRLSRTRDGLTLMVRAILEGLKVLRVLNIPITPAKYRVLALLPEPLLVAFLRKTMNTPRAELLMARHANAARDEMKTLADEFRLLTRASGLATPALDALYSFTDPAVEPLEEGSQTIPLDWRPVIVAGAALAAGLAGWALARRRD